MRRVDGTRNQVEEILRRNVASLSDRLRVIVLGTNYSQPLEAENGLEFKPLRGIRTENNDNRAWVQMQVQTPSLSPSWHAKGAELWVRLRGWAARLHMRSLLERQEIMPPSEFRVLQPRVDHRQPCKAYQRH